MKTVVKTELKLSMGSYAFFLGIFCAAAAAMMGAASLIESVTEGMGLGENVIFFTIAQQALSSDLFCLIVPVACVLTGTTSFLDDVQSRFVWYRYPRSGKRAYFMGKVVTAGVTGGCIASIGALVVFGLCFLLFLPDRAQWTMLGEYWSLYLRFFLENMGLVFLTGVFWAMVSGLFSVLTGSRYIAYAVPFILYYVWTTLLSAYLPKLYILNPREWAAPQRIPVWSAMVIFLVLDGVLAVCFYELMKGRLKNG